jgi:hypothetical protein
VKEFIYNGDGALPVISADGAIFRIQVLWNGQWKSFETKQQYDEFFEHWRIERAT